MNHVSILSLVSLFLLFQIDLSAQQTYTSKSGDEHLWGKISLSDLSEEPYLQWYKKTSDQVDLIHRSEIEKGMNGTNVKVFIGTWCGDTKKGLPEFLQVWIGSGLNTDQLEVIALHNEGALYKRSPEGSEVDQYVHRVPTFIFEKDGHEIGRIVERPVTDWETDIAQIASGIPTSARYQLANKLYRDLVNNSFDSTQFEKNIRFNFRICSGPGELNTLGYVLKAANMEDSAEKVFRINTRFYPFEPNVHDSLGEFYFDQGDWEKAERSFSRVLELKKSDERAIAMLARIRNAHNSR